MISSSPLTTGELEKQGTGNGNGNGNGKRERERTPMVRKMYM